MKTIRENTEIKQKQLSLEELEKTVGGAGRLQNNLDEFEQEIYDFSRNGMLGIQV